MILPVRFHLKKKVTISSNRVFDVTSVERLSEGVTLYKPCSVSHCSLFTIKDFCLTDKKKPVQNKHFLISLKYTIFLQE